MDTIKNGLSPYSNSIPRGTRGERGILAVVRVPAVPVLIHFVYKERQPEVSLYTHTLARVNDLAGWLEAWKENKVQKNISVEGIRWMDLWVPR